MNLIGSPDSESVNNRTFTVLALEAVLNCL